MFEIDIVSVIPEAVSPYLEASILGRAQAAGICELRTHNLRKWTHDRHCTVDDAPFGGGQGMLMKVAPIDEALTELRAQGTPARVIMFSPCGHTFDQAAARRLAAEERLIMVCGRYEGMDERAMQLADEVISLGDYVLTGGELAALAVTDAVVRLLPGALGDEMSAVDESFSDGLLEYAQYTRPADYFGKRVPDVLLSGNHAAIAAWRRQSSLERTARLRPDLLDQAHLTEAERAYVDQLDDKRHEEDR